MSLALILVFLLCVYPFVNLFLKALTPKGELTLYYFQTIFKNPSALLAFKNSLFVALAVALLSMIIAIPLAWLFSRTDLPGQKKFRTWFCLPYAIPPYIGAMAWIYLANPQTGILNTIWGDSIFNIYSYAGLIWVETTFLYTFVLLSSLSFLDRMDPSLEEAARLSGASPLKVFTKITLPLMRSSLMSSFVLVLLGALASFGVPALIGSPARIYLLTTQIYTFQKMGSMKGIYQAVALSSLLLVIAFILLIIQNKHLQGKGYVIVSGKAQRTSQIELKSLKNPIFFLILILLFIILFLPLIALTLTAFADQPGVIGLNFSLKHFNSVFFQMDETLRAFANSFYLGFMAATLSTFLALILAYLRWKTKIRGRRWLEIFASLPYSTPGTVVALALILTFSRHFFFILPSLYNTLALLWLAYMIKYLSLSMKTLGDGYSQIDNSLAEAAQVSGATTLKTFRFIWVPLLKSSLFASWFLVFMPALSELTMTILLTGPGRETVGTLIFQMQEYADPTGGSAAVLALSIVVIVILLNLFIKKISSGRYGL